MRNRTKKNSSQNAGLNTKTTRHAEIQQNLLVNSSKYGIDPSSLIDIQYGVISDAICDTEESQLEFDKNIKGTAYVE